MVLYKDNNIWYAITSNKKCEEFSYDSIIFFTLGKLKDMNYELLCYKIIINFARPFTVLNKLNKYTFVGYILKDDLAPKLYILTDD